MLGINSSRLALAMSGAALFVALGGTALAVTQVGTKQIRNGAVNTSKIKNGAVTGSKLAGGAVGGSALANGVVNASKLAPNSVDSSKVVDDSLTGADINESTLNLPAQPTRLPPSGPAGGDLSGQYPNPQVQESNLTTGGDLSGPLSNAAVDTSKLTIGGGLTGTVSNATVDTSKLAVGGDLTGTVSNAQIGAGTVADGEIADRSADLAVPVQELLPLVGRAGTTATASDIATSNVPALSFSDTADQQVEFVIRVPTDRVASSGMQVAVDWSGTSTGLPVWKLDYLPLATSAVNGSFKSGGSGGTTSFSANRISTFCCLAIPSGDLFNAGEVVVKLTRASSDVSDSLLGSARLEAIEFSYTAKR